MHQVPVSQSPDVLIPDAEPTFCPRPAHKIPDAVLGIAVNLLQGVRGADDREIPPGPGQIMILRLLKKLPVDLELSASRTVDI